MPRLPDGTYYIYSDLSKVRLFYLCPLLQDEENHDEITEILECDDKERFLTLISPYADCLCSHLVAACAKFHAKKCLLAMIQGEGCIPLPAVELYAKLIPEFVTQTPLASVAFFFHEADDIIDLLLNQAPEHANIKCLVGIMFHNSPLISFPIDHLLFSLSSKSPLDQWAPGHSLIKLIILLCQWEMKPSLNSARLLASHTDGLNNLAWECVEDGRLVSLAALLLVAQEKALAPLDSGLTIKQRVTQIVNALSSACNLAAERVKYLSMLNETCNLLDIFERTGDALNLYCSSMHEYVSPHKVLIDVASVLQKAGYVLSPMDVDLRDCYRQCTELKKASVFKLSGKWQSTLTDPESSNNKYSLPSSLTRAHQGFGAKLLSDPRHGDCQLLEKLKSGHMLNLLSSASTPRLLRTAASQAVDGGSGIPQTYLAYIAFRLKRGIKF